MCFDKNKEYRIAVSRLHMENGNVLKNQILEIDSETKKMVRYYPLSREIAFTEWRGGDYYL